MNKYAFYLLSILFAAACRNAPADGQTTAAAAQEKIETAKPEPDSVPVFPIEYLTGKFDYESHPDFTKVDPAYADGPGYYLRREAYEAFQRMQAAAKADGIALRIISASRTFDYQRGIWEAKWTGKRKSNNIFVHTIADPKERALEILKVSAMPGTSRHHWGTDVDLNAVNNGYFESGAGKQVYDWLTANAAAYGFCQPYTAGRPSGYTEEKWHWSYQPLSSQLTKAAAHQLTDEQISGFLGDETALTIGVLEKYILGINPDCLQ
jgi:LAS superfamily LD-carboxypeptidase LdcB